jgi:hypothetical protein
MKKLGIALIIAICVFAGAVAAQAEVVGRFCFTPDFSIDIYVFVVDSLGGGAYQFTGYNPVYPSALNGGGNILDGHLYITMTESISALGIFITHCIDLDLATLTGTTDMVGHDSDGTILDFYVDEPFSITSCPPWPASAEMDGTKAWTGKQ